MANLEIKTSQVTLSEGSMTDETEKWSTVATLIPLAGARQIGSLHVSELPDDIVDQLRADAVAKKIPRPDWCTALWIRDE